MPELTLLCARPHVKAVDFDASRFVASTAQGLNVNGVHLEMGDEIPVGSLSAFALRCEYDATRRIELLEYALTVPALREACARRGVTADAPEAEIFVPDLEELSKRELVELCEHHSLSGKGNKDELRLRLEAFLGR